MGPMTFMAAPSKIAVVKQQLKLSPMRMTTTKSQGPRVEHRISFSEHINSFFAL
jgi:hypothetical protein